MQIESGAVTTSELALCIEAGLLPELTPTHQERSLRNAASILSAGHELLRERALEDLTIEAVCHLAGTTVGAFYGRFASKDAFFFTLQRLALRRTELRLDEIQARHAAGGQDIETMVRDIVELMVDAYRHDVGILRASLQHTKEGMWRLIRASGDRFRAVLADAVAPSLDGPREQARMRSQFAYQAIVGVLVHATLNNPGPLDLEHKLLVPELVRLVSGYLWGTGVTPPGKRERNAMI